MNYFKTLGIIFGLLAFLKPVYMHVLPWDENTFIKKFYSERRPPWIVPIALIGVGLIVLTWYLHFTLDIPHSIYIAVLFSLTAVKIGALLFNYESFHLFAKALLTKNKGRGVVLVDIGVGLVGLFILIVTLKVY